MFILLVIGLMVLSSCSRKTIPAKTMRNAATWYADKCSKPSFIMIKLLPQIMDSRININQFKNPLFMMYKIAAKVEYLQ